MASSSPDLISRITVCRPNPRTSPVSSTVYHLAGTTKATSTRHPGLSHYGRTEVHDSLVIQQATRRAMHPCPNGQRLPYCTLSPTLIEVPAYIREGYAKNLRERQNMPRNDCKNCMPHRPASNEGQSRLVPLSVNAPPLSLRAA